MKLIFQKSKYWEKTSKNLKFNLKARRQSLLPTKRWDLHNTSQDTNQEYTQANMSFKALSSKVLKVESSNLQNRKDLLARRVFRAERRKSSNQETLLQGLANNQVIRNHQPVIINHRCCWDSLCKPSTVMKSKKICSQFSWW